LRARAPRRPIRVHGKNRPLILTGLWRSAYTKGFFPFVGACTTWSAAGDFPVVLFHAIGPLFGVVGLTAAFFGHVGFFGTRKPPDLTDGGWGAFASRTCVGFCFYPQTHSDSQISGVNGRRGEWGAAVRMWAFLPQQSMMMRPRPLPLVGKFCYFCDVRWGQPFFF